MDGLAQYLHEIGQHPLLTKNDEVRLAKLIEAGREAAGREAAAFLDAADLADRPRLRRLVRRGDDARDLFIRANLRLVVSVARRHAGGRELLDVIQDGNVGLMRAVEKFDHSKGFKFSTYATFWITQAIQRGLDEMIHRPGKIRDLDRAVALVAGQIESGGLPATPEAVSEHLGLPLGRVAESMARLRPTSLDAILGEEHTLLSYLGEADDVSAMEVADLTVRILAVLPELEAEVFAARLRGETFAQIGERFGCSGTYIAVVARRAQAAAQHPVWATVDLLGVAA